MSITCITDFFSLVSNQKNTATDMETDGSAILMSDSEPEVLEGNCLGEFFRYFPFMFCLHQSNTVYKMVSRRHRRSPKVTMGQAQLDFGR